MTVKEEITRMLLILVQVMSISFVTLIYLWQHFNYSALFNEIQEIKQTKRKILLEIEKIRLESSKYSSVHRIENLFAEYSPNINSTLKRKAAQKITTLKIPPTLGIEKPSGSKIVKYKW